jgi:hypothetical protein
MYIRRAGRDRGFWQLVSSYRDPVTGKVRHRTLGLGPVSIWFGEPTIEKAVEEQRSLLRGLKRRRFNFRDSPVEAGQQEYARLDREVAKVEARLRWMEAF